MNNILTGNDVGVFAWQGESDLSFPTNTQTNLKVVGNKIDGTGAANLCGYDGLSHPYMFGISDYGVNDTLINNSVTGYANNTPYTGSVDVTGSNAKVHALKEN